MATKHQSPLVSIFRNRKRRDPVPRQQRQGCQNRRLFRQGREREPERRFARAASHIAIEAPERQAGRRQVEMGERALREEDRIQRGANCGAESRLHYLPPPRPGGKIPAEKTRQPGAWRYGSQPARSRRSSTTAPDMPSPAGDARWREWSAESGFRSAADRAQPARSIQLRPRNRAGAAGAHAAPAAP